MPASAPFRFLLAVLALLTLFSGAYEAAKRWPDLSAKHISVPTLAGLPAAVAPLPVAVAPAGPVPCPPRPESLASSPASRRPWVVRRYVGMVGSQPATAVVKWQNPDSVSGSFYLHRGGPTYIFDWYRKQPGPTALYVESDYDDREYGQLTLTGLPTTMLVATWRHVGRPQRLWLRESYAGALRYTFKTLVLASSYQVVSHGLLTLPRSSAKLPVLQARLAASPAALRRRIQADQQAQDGDATATYWDEVRFNGFQLFSYQTSFYVRAAGGTPDRGITSWLFDLRTGRELSMGSQLQPGYKVPLRQLLTGHLLHDPAFNDDRRASDWDWRDDQDRPTSLVSLPGEREALTLTGPGLEATYSFWTMHNTGAGGSEWETTVLVPYRELRPLVRPGTPLARMLQARGLW